MNDSKFLSMTVNERLHIAGLLEDYKKAVQERDIKLVISILKQVDLSMENITPILKFEGLDFDEQLNQL